MARKAKYDSDQTQQKIYDCAVELINEVGLANITVRQVCKKAGISTGVFYMYYPTKQHLLARLADYMEHFYKNDVVPGLSGSRAEKLYRLSMAYIKRTIRRDVDYTREYIRFTNQRGLTFSRHSRLYRTAIFRQAAEEGIARGEFSSSLTAQEIADSLLSICRGLNLSYTQVDGDLDIVDLGDKMVTVFIKGLSK